MQDKPKRNDGVYVREGGPYADLLRELVESGRYGSAAEAVLDALPSCAIGNCFAKPGGTG